MPTPNVTRDLAKFEARACSSLDQFAGAANEYLDALRKAHAANDGGSTLLVFAKLGQQLALANLLIAKTQARALATMGAPLPGDLLN